jgi:ABC-type sugar transport system substrate-binding protein
MPSAVVAANDMMALGVLHELLVAGLRVPDDVSLVGFDDVAFASLSQPPLTTVCLPRAELGRRAVEALLTILEHPDHMGVELRVPTFLIERGSTAPPPSGVRRKRAGAKVNEAQRTRPAGKKGSVANAKSVDAGVRRVRRRHGERGQQG